MAQAGAGVFVSKASCRVVIGGLMMIEVSYFGARLRRCVVVVVVVVLLMMAMMRMVIVSRRASTGGTT